MTQRKHEAPTPLPSPHADLAQEILSEVPLLVPAETYDILDWRAPAGEVALDYVTQMVQHHTGVDLSKHDRPKGLAQADINELAALSDAQYLSRELRIANNFGNNMPHLKLPSMADKPTTKRSQLQATLLDEVAAHYQSLPKGLIYKPDDPLVKRFWDAYLVHAKTGVGKSGIEAFACFLAGVTDDKNTTIRAAVLTSTQALVEEYAGRVGTSTFREFLGKKIPISVYYEYEQDTSGHVVIGSYASAKEFVTGDEGFLVGDEGHNILGPKTMAWLGTLSIRRPLFATATTTYNAEERPPSPNELPRDLRHFCTSSSTRSIADLMKDGILNPTCIREIEYEDDPIPLVCEIAQKYLLAGDRIGIYCEPGKGQPEAIAQLLNEALGKRVIDWIASSRRSESRAIEVEIIEGDLQGFSTCKKLGEGSNIPRLHKAIFINPGSALRLEQQAGRYWRLGDTITELYHLKKRGARPGPSLPKIIGVENADPDRIIGLPADDAYAEDSGKDPSAKGLERPSGILPLNELPTIALAGLINTRKKVVISNEKYEPTEGFVRLNNIVADEDLPALWLQMVFDKAGIGHEIVLTDRGDGTYDYERWYAPELNDWLQEHSLHDIAADTRMNTDEIAQMCETTKEHITEILTDLGIETNKPYKYDFDTIQAVLSEIESIKTAAPGDMPLGETYKEFGSELVAFAIGHPDIPCNIVNRRRHPVHGIKGITGHINEAGIALLRAAHERLKQIPYATPHKYRTLTAIYRQTGIDVATLRNRIPAEGVGEIVIMRRGARTLPTEYLKSDSTDVLRQLKPKPLPSSLIPPAVYKAYFGDTNRVAALAWLSEQGHELVPFPMKGNVRETSCMTWEQFEAADKQFGRANWIQNVDFNKIRGVSDDDPKGIPDEQKAMAYRRSILQRFITDPKILAPPSEDYMDVPATAEKKVPEFDLAHILFPEIFAKPEPTFEPEPTPETQTTTTSAETIPEPVMARAAEVSNPEPIPVLPPTTVAADEPIITPEFHAVPDPGFAAEQIIEPTTTPTAPITEPETPEPKATPEPQAAAPKIPEIIFMEPPHVDEPQQQSEPSRQKDEPKKATKKRKAAAPDTKADEPVIDVSDGEDYEAEFKQILDEVSKSEPAPAAATTTEDVENEETDDPDEGFSVPVIGQAWSAHPERVKTPAPTPRPAPKPAQKPVAPPIPKGPTADSVNIDTELIGYASPLALAYLVKQTGIQVRRDNNKIRWAERDDVELLKLAIQDFDEAPPQFQSASMIAKRFQKKISGIGEQQIIHVVLHITQDLAACTRPYRGRHDGSTPDMLDMYFSASFSDTIIETIERLIRTRHIGAIMRCERLPI